MDGLSDQGAGGAVYSLSQVGRIENNTFVDNTGVGDVPCSGGGIVVASSRAGFIIRNNIIAFNNNCGLVCYYENLMELGPNLLWGNMDGDLGEGTYTCPSDWLENLIIADPLFCDPENDDYRISVDSPARQGSVVMGAFADPGCN